MPCLLLKVNAYTKRMKMLGKLLTFLLTLFLPFLEGTNIV